MHRLKVTLGKMGTKVLSSPDKVPAELSGILGIDVLSYQITSLDNTSDMERVIVQYRDR